MTAPAEKSRSGVRWALWLPLVLFAGFVVLAVNGMLRPAEREVESALVGKPVPDFVLPAAVKDRPGLSAADLRAGKPVLLNIFASWCIPCATEAPQLERLRQAGHAVHGVAIRDRPEDLAAFLARNGNPFASIGADNVSTVQLALGSSGVPETFVIDGRGIIRHQHIGEIRPEDVPKILARLEEAAR